MSPLFFVARKEGDYRYMADYTVVVQGKLQGFDELDRYEQKIKSLDGTKIKIELDDSGIGTLLSSSSSNNKQYQNIGKNISQNISKGIKSVKINNPIDFSKQQQEYRNKIKGYQQQMMSGVSGLNEKDAAKDANAYFKAEQKAAEKASKESAKRQKQDLAQTKKNQSAMDKVQTRQKFNELKSNASNRNAHYNELVAEGKAFKTKLEQEQSERRKLQIKEETENKKQIQKAQSSVSRTQFQQYWGSLEHNASQKNAHYNELVNSGKEYIRTLEDVKKIRERAQSGEFELRNAKNDSFLSNYVNQNSEALTRARTQIEEIRSLQKELQTGVYESGDNKGLKIIPDDQITKAGQLDEKISQLNNTMKQVRVESSKSLEEGVALRGANNVASYMEANSKAIKKYGSDLKALEQAYRSITTAEEKADLDRKFANLKSTISAEGLTGKSPFDDFKRAFTQIAQFTGIYATLQNVMLEVPQKMISSVKDINASQIELMKVSTASDSDLSKYWDEAADSAKKYGAAISDVISSTADWSRLGYSLDDAKKLSDATTLLQKVGDNMTQESSSSGMIATLKGFQMDADQAMDIVDKINQVANTQPIDTKGLFEGLERSASSMNAANNSLEQTIALISAANSVVQDPDSIGTAMKTKFLKNCLYVQKCA